ncbi:MAG: M55 family metallopeptidase [Gemmatimonadetes bacterium]|nr:M55 family metallopeptidase [Gemmatimonadota bacterium]
MHRLPATLLALVPLALVPAAQAQGTTEGRPLKVMVLYDMEGVSGVSDWRMTSFRQTDRYAEGRKSLTADVNAAIAGLKAAGVSDILVVDGHGSGNFESPDVLEDQLLAPAKMVSRDAPFDIYMDSYDHSIDAIVAIGMHAGAGNRQGFLSHTYTFEDVEYRVNGVPFNETMILAAGAGRLRIPVIMVSGDDQLERELKRMMPWVRYAMTKHAVDRSKAEPLARDEASRRIEAAAREAVLKLTDAKIPEWAGPYRFQLTFQDELQARNASYVAGAQLGWFPTMVEFRAGDFEEGYRQSLKLIRMAGAVAAGTSANAILEKQPNAQALGLDEDAWAFERFLTGPTPPAASGSAPKRRYWGAR